jgi:hypothetical protein
MASPLEGSIRKAIGKGMQGLFLPGTIARDVPRTSSTEEFDPLPPVTKTYACKAVVDNYSAFRLASGLIQAGDRKILVLAEGLEVDPKPGDRITVRGATYTAVEVATDPAQAVWVIQGRS